MRNKLSFLKFITEFFRIIVGITFTFSGFVKAVDPLGFTYKIQDYLILFDLVSLFPLALPVSIILVVAEMLIGLFLLLGIYRKATSFVVTLFMLFFLPLTLWIAISNPVEDCGCFGDAWVITNWQTFYKNIILFIGAIVLVKNYRLIKPLFSEKTSWISALITIAFGFSFAIYNTVKLPVFDFRPFSIGSDIAENMMVDPEKGDIVENIFIYSKEGVKQEFTEENYPWDDSTWVYVDMESRIIHKGEKPQIEDFHINLYDRNAELNEYYVADDITDAVLENNGFTLLMVSYFLDEMNLKHLDRFYQADKYAKDNNIDFYVLTSSLSDEISEWNELHSSEFKFAEADERVLKTMIRSNPGLIMLHNGVVVNKWDDSEIPDLFKKSPEMWDKRKDHHKNIYFKFMVIFLSLFLPLIFLRVIDNRISK